MSEIIANYQIKADMFLLEYLRPRSTERTSKLDAFCELMNMAMSQDTPSEETRFGTTVHLHQGQFIVTVTDLAKKWNWHRVTVKSFLDKLVALNYAEMFSQGKFFVIAMRFTQPSEQERNLVSFTKDEQRLVRWLSGYISIEEVFSSSVDFFKDTDAIFKPQETDSKADAGARLHRFISHLILSHTDLIPVQPDVNIALATLFTEHCHHDFIEFWRMLSLGGLLFSSTQSPILKPHLSELSEEVKKLSDIIFAHYGTMLHCAPIENKK
ncbi:hypothetical protein [Bacteroides sp. 51]|uniref:hypothetical protein n=1 Tax=Bacteroides sp. 51 TaxID=2302938 RepID=UPI0013D28DAA|nr:hypothetical protein [Bacteroides sp. 51]NDV84766.1 hypothetical protein [Bacteroides sp. 51]